MIAYDEIYLSGAQRRLGGMFEFAVGALAFDLASFFGLFCESAVSTRFAAGDPAVVAGRSGEELALDVAVATGSAVVAGGNTPVAVSNWRPTQEFGPVYWTGWALACYQWASGMTFADIGQRVPIGQVASLYAAYHEMDLRQFCDRMDELCTAAQPLTNLKARRLAAGLSQSQLAIAARIPVRTLQQYEQRQKDINRARVDYVVSLARVLCCESADLLEHHAAPAFEYAFVKL